MESALNVAFSISPSDLPPHRRMGLIRVMAHLKSARALTMMAYQYLKGTDNEAAHIWAAALTQLNLEKVSPTDAEIEFAEVQMQTMGNLGSQYLKTSRSFQTLKEAPAEDQDAHLMIQYLALLGSAQQFWKLFDAKRARELVIQIIDQAEVDPEFGDRMTDQFKVGSPQLNKIENLENWIFFATQQLGHPWILGRSAALARGDRSRELKAIDDFSSAVLGLAMLERLGILDLTKAKQLFENSNEPAHQLLYRMLRQPNADATRWDKLRESIREQLPKITAATTFDAFSQAVVKPEAASISTDQPTRFGWLRGAVPAMTVGAAMAFLNEKDPFQELRVLLEERTPDAEKLGELLRLLEIKPATREEINTYLCKALTKRYSSATSQDIVRTAVMSVLAHFGGAPELGEALTAFEATRGSPLAEDPVDEAVRKRELDRVRGEVERELTKPGMHRLFRKIVEKRDDALFYIWEDSTDRVMVEITNRIWRFEMTSGRDVIFSLGWSSNVGQIHIVMAEDKANRLGSASTRSSMRAKERFRNFDFEEVWRQHMSMATLCLSTWDVSHKRPA